MQKALIIVDALFQMHPDPVSFITFNMWYWEDSFRRVLSPFLHRMSSPCRRYLTSWTYGSRRCIVFSLFLHTMDIALGRDLVSWGNTWIAYLYKWLKQVLNQACRFHPPLGFQIRHVPQMQNNLMLRLLSSWDDVCLVHLLHWIIHPIDPMGRCGATQPDKALKFFFCSCLN